MKNKTLFIILLSVMIFGCQKENNQPNNGTNGSSSTPAVTTGTLYLKNTQSDPYIIYLDGTNIGTLASLTTSNANTVTSGIGHSLKAEQKSGYIFYPTVFNCYVLSFLIFALQWYRHYQRITFFAADNRSAFLMTSQPQ